MHTPSSLESVTRTTADVSATPASTAPAQAHDAPQLLSLDMLRHVAGGGPGGSWSEGPGGSW